MRYKYLTLVLLLTLSTNAFSQGMPPEFITGLKTLPTDRPEAKKNFLISVNKDPSFFGSYHFLGTIYLAINSLDSASWYFKKAIQLNNTNVNHTKELTYVRLINTYAYQHDFKNGFTVGWEALKLYPDNTAIKSALKDLCQWAFYIKYDHLDPSYLAMAIRDEYLVTSINQEYLILRKLRIDDETPVIIKQSLVAKNNASYDVFNCSLPTSKKTVVVNCRLNWDLTKEFGGKTSSTQPVIADVNTPVYEKVGAMLIADDKTDIKLAIEKLTN